MAARRFKFRLQTVLEQRERAEEEEQRKVAALERERLSVEDKLRAYQVQISGAKQEMRDYLGGRTGVGTPVQLAAARMQASASLHLVGQAQQTVFELAGVHRRLEAARRQLLKATAARKAVALLKERQFEEWKQEINKREAQELDEMTVMRHGRADAGLETIS